MRQFKVLPTNEVVDDIYNKHVVGKDNNGETKEVVKKEGYDVTKQSVKGRHLAMKGKLTPEDVDMIRCLSTLGFKKSHIQKYYNIKTSIRHIADHDIFSKHFSPFEEILDGYRFWINPILLEDFKTKHKNEIKDFMNFSLNEELK